ncbi:MAG: hypothetical protein GY859_12410, partial [Desulfobacterales bacterium]|nr:hypothetical protein [Desulfobacterales bacterium]
MNKKKYWMIVALLVTLAVGALFARPASASAPMVDGETGGLIAAPGMDAPARTGAAGMSALLAGLALALLIQRMAGEPWAQARPEVSVRPIRKRLLFPLSGVLLLLVCGVGAGFVKMQQTHLQEQNQKVLNKISDELAESLAEQSDALTALGLV